MGCCCGDARRLPVGAQVEPIKITERREPVILGLGAVVILTAALTIAPVSNNDIWIHLTTGEIILRDRALPQTDPYSFSAAGHPYLVHEWLSAVVFAQVFRLTGVPGLTVLKFLVITGTVVALFLTCRLQRDRLVIVIPALALMEYVAAQRYLERPHIFTFLFSSLYLYLLARYRVAGGSRTDLALIIPLHVLWTNLHSGFFLGLAILTVFAVAAAGTRVRRRLCRTEAENSVGNLTAMCGLPLVCLVASLANPYGAELLAFPFRLTGMEIYMARIFEWRPPLDPAFRSTFMFYGYWVWTSLLLASFIVRVPGTMSGSYRQKLVDGAFMLSLLVFAYAFMWQPQWVTSTRRVWMVLAVAWCLWRVRKLDFAAAGLTAVALFISLQHNRAVADALVITFPVLTRNLSDLLRYATIRQPPRRLQRLETVAAPFLSFLVILLALHVHVFGYYYTWSGRRQGGIGIGRNMPVCAVDYVVRRGLTGNAFTSYTTAALLIHRRYPAVKVSMDSRNEVYGPALFEEFERSKETTTAMAAYLRKYPVDFFLVAHNDLSPQITYDLLSEGTWAQVFFDDRTYILVRRDRAAPGLIERDGYQFVFPALLGSNPVPASHAEAYFRESSRALAECPDAWLPRWYRAQALLHLDRKDEAVRDVVGVIARRPDWWEAWALLAVLREATGDSVGALAAYERAVRLNPAYHAGKEALTRLGGS